jgi:uncharacterized membrane protein
MTSIGDWGLDQITPVLATLALLGSALVGGIFFAFSSFVMKALAQVPPSEGIDAMQSINIVVINRSFLGAFFGTAVVSLAAGAIAFAGSGRPATPYLLAGAVVYLVGVFLVTMLGNVPLNDELAAMSATDPEAQDYWLRYVSRWTMWNHVRTAGGMVAAVLYSLAAFRSQS